VSNSVIKPEVHRFATQVSNRLMEAYPGLFEDDDYMRPKLAMKMAKARKFGRRAHSIQSGFSATSDYAPQDLPVLM